MMGVGVAVFLGAAGAVLFGLGAGDITLAGFGMFGLMLGFAMICS